MQNNLFLSSKLQKVKNLCIILAKSTLIHCIEVVNKHPKSDLIKLNRFLIPSYKSISIKDDAFSEHQQSGC